MSEKTRTRLLRAPRRIRSYLAANAGAPVLLLAANEEAAERYAGEAAIFTGGPVVHLPSRGVAFGDVFDQRVQQCQVPLAADEADEVPLHWLRRPDREGQLGP